MFRFNRLPPIFIDICNAGDDVCRMDWSFQIAQFVRQRLTCITDWSESCFVCRCPAFFSSLLSSILIVIITYVFVRFSMCTINNYLCFSTVFANEIIFLMVNTQFTDYSYWTDLWNVLTFLLHFNLIQFTICRRSRKNFGQSGWSVCLLN